VARHEEVSQASLGGGSRKASRNAAEERSVCVASQTALYAIMVMIMMMMTLGPQMPDAAQGIDSSSTEKISGVESQWPSPDVIEVG
jgi:hypothetical protein